MGDEPWSGLDVRVIPSAGLAAGDRTRLAALFAASYREADAGYLDESLRRLACVSMAFRDEELVAFALSEGRRIDLPRLPGCRVGLGGLACVAPAFRRRHLMSGLSRLGMRCGLPEEPALVCGRMAHPATFRGMRAMPSAVPRRGARPTPWQRDVGCAIAAAYGVRAFDPETFVCRGGGRSIGTPVLDVDATPEEWDLFAGVDRSHGDALLAIAWLDEAPEGW